LKTPIHVPKIGFLSEKGSCVTHTTQCGTTIHPTVWPQHTNVTDRTDNGLGRTDLETVDQKFNDFWCTYVHECR